MSGIKHLIECHCYLAIFKNSKKMINHKFPVYSKLDDYNNLIPKLVKCNNCEALHYVSSIGTSELRPGKDQSDVLLKKEDIALMLPEKVRNILISVDSDISNYEHALDIIEDKNWNIPIVIKRDVIDEIEQVKIMTITDKNNVTISVEKINNLAIKE